MCRVCNGTGAIPIKEQVQDVIGRLRSVMKRLPIISTEHSLMLRFIDADDCLLSFNALQYNRLKARIILENNI